MLTDQSQLNTENSLTEEKINLKKIYRDGVITNVLNPKVALFFMAFLPQFIDPTFSNTVLPFLALGITFTITGTIWCLILASFASIISDKLKNNKKLTGHINKICGTALIGLGIKVALTDRK
jgi:threonine/homoserine/homoserine lactone efflux protein